MDDPPRGASLAAVTAYGYHDGVPNVNLLSRAEGNSFAQASMNTSLKATGAGSGEPLLATSLRAYGGSLELMASSFSQDVSSLRTSQNIARANLAPTAPNHVPPHAHMQNLMGGDEEEEALASIDAIRGELDTLTAELHTLKANEESELGPRTTMGNRVKTPKVHPLARLRRDELLAQRRADWERALAAHAAPAGRAEATALSHVVARLLPLGQLADTLIDERNRLSLDVVAREYELLDMCLRETARQVGSTVSERGTLVEDIRARLSELVGVVVGEAQAMQRREATRAAKLQHVKSELAGTSSELQLTRGDLATARAEHEAMAAELKATQAQLSQARAMHESAAAQLRAENDDLRAQLEAMRSALGEMEMEKDAAAGRVAAAMEDEVSRVSDERDDVLARLRFVEIQLNKAKAEKLTVGPDLMHVGVQTDRHYEVATPKAAEETTGDKPKEKKKKRDRASELGIFVSYVAEGVKGRIKNPGWTMRTIMQIYADKATSDATDEREGLKPSSLADFAYQWHLNRFGLRGLADQNVADLCRSAKKVAKESTFVTQFCAFAELPEGASRPSGDEAVSFYVKLYAHLARGEAAPGTFASGASAMKDSSEGALPFVKPDSVHGAARDVLKVFINPQLEEDGGASSSSGVIVNANYAEAVHELVHGKLPLLRNPDGVYSLELVMHAFMDEWMRRRREQEDALLWLWRAADADGSNTMSYDEFCTAVRQVDRKMTDRSLARIYREALKLTSANMMTAVKQDDNNDGMQGPDLSSLENEHVSAEAFVSAMRKHGFGSKTFVVTSNMDADAGMTDVADRPEDMEVHKESRRQRLRQMLEDAVQPGEMMDSLCAELDRVYDAKAASALPKDVHDMVVRARLARDHLRSMMSREGGDVEASWAAYRMLISQTRSALVRVKGTLKRTAEVVRLTNAMAKAENTGLMQLLKPPPSVPSIATGAASSADASNGGETSARKTLLLSPDL